MLTISIRATRKRWWGTQTKTWRRQLPQSWLDMQPRRRHFLYVLLLSHRDAGMTAVTKYLMNLPPWAYRDMEPEDMAAIQSQLEWMRPAINCESLPFPSFVHRGTEYYFPKPKFENGSCLDFVLADGYYHKYSNTLDETHLLRLVATLCRPASAQKESARLSGDIRMPIRTKEEVEAIAQQLERLDPVYRSVALLYWIGVKEYINRTYWMLFTGPNTEQPEGAEPPATNGPKFGWWSKFMEVAESGLFGNYDQVLQKRLHLICMYLVDQQSKSERASLNLAQQQAKNEYESATA